MIPALQADDSPAGLRQASRSGFRAIAFDRFCADDAYLAAWRRLERFALLPMQNFVFSAALSRTLLATANIVALLVSADAGDVGAILPLCRGTGYLARWRMMGTSELSEPNDALCDSPESALCLAEAMARESRPFSLDRIPTESLLIPALQQAMKGRGWISLRPAVPCPTVTLDESWNDPESRFNSGRRSDFRRAARKAAEFGAVSYEVLAPAPDAFDALFDEAIEVEVRSWKKDAGTAIAVDRSKEAFFREYFRSACAQGAFRIAFMRIDGKAVAMQMAVECSQRYWLFKIGYDEDFRKCSPGTLLMLHTLGYAASRPLRAYEMLGDIEPWIATFWTQEQRDCLRLRTYPFNARGAAAFAADAGIWLRARLATRPEK